MRFNRVDVNVYAPKDRRFAIQKTFNGEWAVYKKYSPTSSLLEYIGTYKYLADAKKYVETFY